MGVLEGNGFPLGAPQMIGAMRQRTDRVLVCGLLALLIYDETAPYGSACVLYTATGLERTLQGLEVVRLVHESRAGVRWCLSCA